MADRSPGTRCRITYRMPHDWPEPKPGDWVWSVTGQSTYQIEGVEERAEVKGWRRFGLLLVRRLRSDLPVLAFGQDHVQAGLYPLYWDARQRRKAERPA